MRQAMSTGLVSCFLVLALQGRCTTLPDACGSDMVKFDVTLKKGQPAPALPAPGNAQIVFIEDEDLMVAPFSSATVRFGMDGSWMGADNGNSYFVVDIAPGVHHFCASWQSKRSFDLAPVNAEAGKVYYFAAEVTVSEYGNHLGLSQLNDDQGQYRLKAWKRSTSRVAPKDEY